MAAAAPIGTEITTTAIATMTVLSTARHIRASLNRSTNQRDVSPIHG